MDIIRTTIPEVVILQPKIYTDERGYFCEAFSDKRFSSVVCNNIFVQENEARSVYGVLRGLHYQKSPYSQGKLVRCVQGCILDVAVDLRKDSPTYAQHVAVELNENNHWQLFVPRGFAHGVITLSRESIMQYRCDSYYAPEHEAGIIWNDPTLNINWQLPENEIILSAKDLLLPDLNSANINFSMENCSYGEP